MQLDAALKTSLGELRMLMLGSQVLFGFQFQGLFQDNFRALPSSGRIIDAVGLALMIAVIGLVIAVPSQHRLVEKGETTWRIYLVSMGYATFALAPLAAALGCDMFVATRGPFGPTVSTATALATFIMAAVAWYLLGSVLKRKWDIHESEIAMQPTKTPLHVKIEQMLTEARVVLPGAQALLGFQLIVMMTRAFDELPAEIRYAHLAALMSLALAITLLISPAAIHRLSFNGRDDPRLHSVGSVLITTAMLPLAGAIACDVWVALTRLFGEGSGPLCGALAVFILLLALWFVFPLLLKRAHHPPANRWGREA